MASQRFYVELISTWSARRNPSRQYMFRVRSRANGQIITWSEHYTFKATALEMIEALHPDLELKDGT